MLSFYKREPLTIEARYSYPNDIPYSESKIGQYCIEQIQPQPDGTPSKIKVKVRLNRNGIFDITQASLIESVEEDSTVPEEMMDTTTDKAAVKDGKVAQTPPSPQQQQPPPSSTKATPPPQPAPEMNGTDQNAQPTETMDEGAAAPNDAGDVPQEGEKDKEEDGEDVKKGEKKTKKKKKEIELPVTSRLPGGSSRSELDRLIEFELEMISQDKKEKERSDAKNSVEEYVYEMRGKIDGGGEFEKYTDDKHKQKFLHDLRTTEDWLYDDGANQERSVYVDRLKGLKSHGDPIKHRYMEAEHRQMYFQELGKSLQRVDEAVQQWHAKDEKYSHLEQSEIEKVHKLLKEKEQWYDQSMNRMRSQKLHDDPTILCSQIIKEREQLERESWAILNKPKPKVELPKDDDKTKQSTTTDAKDNKKPSPAKNQQNEQQPQQQQQQPTMDVD